MIRNFVAAVLLAAVGGLFTSPVSASEPDDADIRINPQVDTAEVAMAEDIVIPPFVRIASNRIQMNGADWSRLRNSLGRTANATFSIVHIGDSHLQADVATSIVRRDLQSRYGDAGRGLIIPFKMAGTNEPRDYLFRGSEKVWVSAKMMKHPWSIPMGFTGIATTPMEGSGTIEIATLSRDSTPQLFDRVRMFHSMPPELSLPDSITRVGRCDSLVTTLAMPGLVSEGTFDMSISSEGSLFGLSLERSAPGGLLYHVIGNNGATYTSYNSVDGFSRGVGLLDPSLIIISLGTNEAFSRLTSDEMYSSIAVMVASLRWECPEALLLLTTPMECQKRTVIRRKGRRKRYSYAVNPRVAAMREVILRYGRDHHIPVYDFYEVAGGAGASAKWISDGMMARDRIHNSVKGYNVQGTLLYRALTDAFADQATK